MTIDIHPHVISRDEKRYPRAPLVGTKQDVRLDDPRSFPAWECAVEEGLPICVQVRAPGLAQLEAMLKRFPKAKVTLDHMARPAHGDLAQLCALAKHQNLYLKLTTHN